MASTQKNLFLFFASIIISFLLSVSFVKVITDNQTSNLISPTIGSDSKLSKSAYQVDNPPSLSLKGNVATYSGEVLWQSRVATEPAKLTEKKGIQQGEVLKTGQDGKSVVSFPEGTTITLFANSEVNFAQTLPSNLVLVQTKGSVDYLKQSSTNLSIRALHLLIEPSSGEIGIAIDSDKHTVSLNAAKGSAKVAFNDSSNTTTILSVPEGKQYFFDDDTRISKLK